MIKVSIRQSPAIIFAATTYLTHYRRCRIAELKAMLDAQFERFADRESLIDDALFRMKGLGLIIVRRGWVDYVADYQGCGRYLIRRDPFNTERWPAASSGDEP